MGILEIAVGFVVMEVAVAVEVVVGLVVVEIVVATAAVIGPSHFSCSSGSGRSK